MVKDIIKGIIDNNGAFVAAHGEAYFKPHMTAQHPRITLVACCDSRVQPLVIDPDPIDRVFTIETIGNQVASAQGSVDYGILHLHTPVLLIMGHSDCGAVKAFMKGYEKENDAIKGELDNLKATITEPGTGDFEEALVKNVKQNVLNQVIGAVKRYQTLVDEGRLTVVGAYYDFVNTFGKGFGRVVLLSVNGVTDAAKMRAMPQLAGLDLGASLGI
ncbi:MAG TPA: carbonic anhydrase [Deltaproteobacteria bacterium]|nr:carbonic anhydrase [Deltaproteobacteria bacterium]